jgi:hypothetical protein
MDCLARKLHTRLLPQESSAFRGGLRHRLNLTGDSKDEKQTFSDWSLPPRFDLNISISFCRAVSQNWSEREFIHDNINCPKTRQILPEEVRQGLP